MMRAAIAQLNFRAHRGQQLPRRFNVAHLRDIFDDYRLVCEQSRSHARECGILRATDADRPQQRVAPANYQLIHASNLASILLQTSG
jgi:hypothetical protein